MQGTLQEISVYELLQLIELNQVTGKLILTADHGIGPHYDGRFRFLQGRIIHGGPQAVRHERIRDYLHRLNLDFSPAGLQSVLSEDYNLFSGELAEHISGSDQQQDVHPYRQGHPEYILLCALIANKKLSWQQGKTLIQRLVNETVFDALALHSGTFQLTSLPWPEVLLTEPMAITPNVMQLQQDLQAWKQLYPWIKHSGQRPRVSNAAILSRSLTSDTFRHFTRWTDGSLSLRRLARHLNRSDLAVAQALYPYVERSIICLQTP